MKHVWLALLGLTLPFLACSQSVTTFIGAHANGLGNSTACIVDEWSVFNNIGALSKTKETSIAFAYDSRATLSAANRAASLFILPLKYGVAGAGVFRFGDALYNEHVITAGYSNSFGITSLGIKGNYIQYRAEGFGSRNVLSLSIGTFTQLTPALSIGAHVVNINRPKISSIDKERVPTILVAALGFTASSKVFITTEIEKNIEYKSIWKAGLEYKAHAKFHIRTGINLNPTAGFFGLAFKPKRISLDYGYRYQPNLGASHQASVAYKLIRK